MAEALCVELEGEGGEATEAARHLSQCSEALQQVSIGSITPAQYAQYALSGALGTPLEAQRSASSAASYVHGALTGVVPARRHELLRATQSIASLQPSLSDLRSRALPLADLAHRARSEIVPAHESACAKASQLANIRSTALALRECSKAVKLAIRCSSNDLARATHAASQLLHLLDTENANRLDGIAPADDARARASAAISRARSEAPPLLRKACENGSMADAASAAQALSSVGSDALQSACRSVASERAQSAAVSLVSGSPDEASSHAIAAWRLQRALAKRRDTGGQRTLLELMDDHPSPAFMRSLVSELKDRASSKVGSSGFASTVQAVETMLSRVHRECRANGVPPAAHEGSEAQLLGSLAPAERAFAEQCRRRLLDAAEKAMWAYSSSKLVGKLHEEVHAASAHPRAASACASACAEAIERFAACSGSTLIGTSKGDATLHEHQHQRQPAQSDGLSQAESRSLAFSCALQHASEAAESILNRTKTAIAAGKTEQLDRLSEAGNKASAASNALMSSVLRLWKNRIDQCAEKALEGVSDLERVLETLGNEVVLRSPNGSLGKTCIEDTVKHCVRVWLRHVSIDRNINAARAAESAKKLESAISRLLVRIEAIVPEGSMLRAFRRAVRGELWDDRVHEAEKKLPVAVAIHLHFASAPKDLQAPHERAQLSVSQYSAWLDTHSDADLWRSVKGSLDSYEHAKAQAGEELHDAHERILQLGNRLGLLKHSSESHQRSSLK